MEGKCWQGRQCFLERREWLCQFIMCCQIINLCPHACQANSQMYLAEVQASAMMGRTEEMDASAEFTPGNISVLSSCDLIVIPRADTNATFHRDPIILLHGEACVFRANADHIRTI